MYDVEGLAPGHLEGLLGGGAATLLHVQRACPSSVQQYTIWEVPRLEVAVVAFRGTQIDEPRDIFINLAFGASSLAPVLPPAPHCAASKRLHELASPIHIHEGVLAAVRQQAVAIAGAIWARYSGGRPAAGRFRPCQLIISGHSLGGAYATALLLLVHPPTVPAFPGSRQRPAQACLEAAHQPTLAQSLHACTVGTITPWPTPTQAPTPAPLVPPSC